MKERKEVGRHSIELHVDQPDHVTVVLVYDGDVTRDEARVLSETFSDWIDGKDAKFLVDVRGLGEMGPEARRELAATRRTPRVDRNYRIAIAFIGANLRTRVLMSVATAAVSLTSNMKMTTDHFTDVQAGRRWAGLAEA